MSTVSGLENRKALRTVLPAEIFFNVLNSPDEYGRGNASILRRMVAMDSVQPTPGNTAAQILLSRLDQKLSMVISLLSEFSVQKHYDYHATLINASEFGLAFISSRKLSEGTNLEIGLQLSFVDARVIDIGGKVVNSRLDLDSGDKAQFIYGVEFFDILGKDQHSIMQWLHEYQREQIRRRKERDIF